MAHFCTKCGVELIDGVCPKCTQEQGTSNKQDEKFKRFFMNPKEKLVTSLGNTYIQNFLNNGSLKKGFAVVSDKRVYFQGTTYEMVTKNSGRKKVIKTRKSRTVDLKDVTGTGYDSYSPLLAILVLFFLPVVGITLLNCLMSSRGETTRVLSGNVTVHSSSFSSQAILLSFFVLLLLVPIAFAIYKRLKLNLVAIQFAGGEIAFDIRWFSEKEIADFQKQLRLAKDKAIEEADNAVANKLQAAVSSVSAGQQASQVTSVADEIAKYGDLLEKGLITQEEFDKKKQELL